jgi:hypothetical protein
VLICIPEVLSKDDMVDFRRVMADEVWENAMQGLVHRLGRNDPEVRKLTNIYNHIIRNRADL